MIIASKPRFAVPIAVAAAVLTTGFGAEAGSVSLSSSGGTFGVRVTSIKEARFNNVIQQQYDFSCGSAAVATVLTYHYEHPTSEATVFTRMYEQGDQETIRTDGFSLLDMKTFLESEGYASDGYRVGLEKLTEAGIPGIVLIDTKGYRHFVVVKGVTDDEVLVADPAMGNKVYDRAEFEAMWNDIVFVILDDQEVAARHFNVADEWNVRQKAPMGTALMRDGLTYFTLMLPGQNYF